MSTLQRQSNFNKSSKFALVVFALCGLATTLPISTGYFSAFLILCWLVFSKRSREISQRELLAQFDYFVFPIHMGVCGLFIAHLVAAMIAYLTSDDQVSIKLALRPTSHIFTKWVLLWFVLAFGVRRFLRVGIRPIMLGKWLAGWLGIHLIYCVLQRYIGIDWVHGFSASLGSNRLAYGVYRISGFMGHPLTLSYNLVLIVLTALPFVFFASRTYQRIAWLASTVFALATLLISGSRFPVFSLFITCGLGLGHILWQWRWRLLASVFVFVFALYLEESFFRRISELFDVARPIEERFDRLIFWRVHWDVFLEHPIAGAGMWAIDDLTEKKYRAINFTERMYGAHNIFLQQMADSGMLGFLGMCSLFAGVFVSARRVKNIYSIWNPMLLLGLGGITTGMLQNNFRDSEFVFCFWFLLSIAAAEASSETHPAKTT